MIDLEITLVETFHWSLYDIDRTAVESLIPFIRRFNATRGDTETEIVSGYPAPMMYCDQVDGW